MFFFRWGLRFLIWFSRAKISFQSHFCKKPKSKRTQPSPDDKHWHIQKNITTISHVFTKRHPQRTTKCCEASAKQRAKKVICVHEDKRTWMLASPARRPNVNPALFRTPKRRGETRSKSEHFSLKAKSGSNGTRAHWLGSLVKGTPAKTIARSPSLVSSAKDSFRCSRRKGLSTFRLGEHSWEQPVQGRNTHLKWLSDPSKRWCRRTRKDGNEGGRMKEKEGRKEGKRRKEGGIGRGIGRKRRKGKKGKKEGKKGKKERKEGKRKKKEWRKEKERRKGKKKQKFGEEK